MIPQSVKDILSNGENVGFYSTLSMVNRKRFGP